MKYSIIIPTWGKHSTELLKRCCDSIVEHTILRGVEIVVSANQCPESTREYVNQMRETHKNVTLVWNEEQLGYSKAINKGVEASKGAFLVFLNNDTMVQGSDWLSLLHQPFKDPMVGVSGPMKTLSPETGRLFLIFFCVMVTRPVFEALGGLDDKIFTLGWGEDTHFCHQVEDKLKMRIVQVPHDATQPTQLERLRGNSNIGCGNFPMWHEGGMSIRELGKKKGDALINKNSATLKKLYGQKIPHIDWASRIGGFMSEDELRWLATMAKKVPKGACVIEVGSWEGRSSRAIADNLPDGTTLFCIDHFLGSNLEREWIHKDAQLQHGDAIAIKFYKNMWDHIQSGKVVPMRMHSKYAAEILAQKEIKAFWIFIDGGHEKGEAKADIKAFLPLLKKGGVISGHDYMHEDGMWPNVTIEVLEIFQYAVGRPDKTHIWYSDAHPEIKPEKRAVFDCFTMYNELDMLELRLNTLDHVVDRFVISESTTTHQGNPKPLYFQENLNRFSKFLHKITYISVPFYNIPENDQVWGRERQQRDNLMLGLPADEEAIVIISDIDEIPRPETIQDFKDDIATFDMDFYYYNFNNKSEHTWQEAKIVLLSKLRQMSPCQVRYTKGTSIIPNGGWHLSYFGGIAAIRSKIENFAHAEYNKPEFKDLNVLSKRVNEGLDLYGRPDEKYKQQPTQLGQGCYPKYLEDNLKMFMQKGWIK